MNSNEVLNYTNDSFNNTKYYNLQKNAIAERMKKFEKGKLYLEIGGKFLYDPHGARVLPGFDPMIKQKILADLIKNADILFCVDYLNIIGNRQLKNSEESYIDTAFEYLDQIRKNIGIKPKVVINRMPKRSEKNSILFTEFIKKLEAGSYQYFKRYRIKGYPENINKILSVDGFGHDEYIKSDKKLLIVTGAGSNSGKMSTCLGQIYLDSLNGLNSGYAKYELFPIWNLDINHPVNLAYESATVDIGDYNVWDKNHFKEYNEKAVNYNRDNESYKIVKNISEKIVSESNFMRKYKSATDMGINMAGKCITNDKDVCIASLEEINRRANWYKEIVARGDGKLNWVTQCYSLAKRAEIYMKKQGYI